ncbi:MAG: hypothetical protein ACRD3B_15570, partial [Candidatus Sulfotelmatobacter sp.]
MSHLPQHADCSSQSELQMNKNAQQLRFPDGYRDASPRAAMAFSALAVADWIRERLASLKRRLKVHRGVRPDDRLRDLAAVNPRPRKSGFDSHSRPATLFSCAAALLLLASAALAQQIDNTQATNTAAAGINKSLTDEIGAGRGSLLIPGSSIYLIKRDPYRSIRRGRQVFQRKFTHAQGQGPNEGDGGGDLNTDPAIGAGLTDSCALCHGRPRGSAGSGGNVATRPDSRDTPHLFGLGLREMLADEITSDLRNQQALAVKMAQQQKRAVTVNLASKGISYGSVTANPDGSIDTSKISGVDSDLRVKPFSAEGGVFSMRQFIVTAFHNEMGLEASSDPDILAASQGKRVVTPSGMVLDGSKDKVNPPPAPDPQNGNEIDPALVDHLEFYLLNYFKPAHDVQNSFTKHGRAVFNQIGCSSCHVANFTLNRDRRVADVETAYDPVNGVFNTLFSTASTLYKDVPDGSGFPNKKLPLGNS